MNDTRCTLPTTMNISKKFASMTRTTMNISKKFISVTSVPLHNKDVAQTFSLSSAQRSEPPPGKGTLDVGTEPLGQVWRRGDSTARGYLDLSLSDLLTSQRLHLKTVKLCLFSTLPGTG